MALALDDLVEVVEPTPPVPVPAVVIAVGGRRICLEVEAVEEVLRVPGLLTPAGQTLPWASAVARTSDGLLPVIDIPALGGRLVEGGV